MDKRVLFILLLVLIVGSFLRLYQLSSIPPGVYPDEAINANQAFSEPGQIFYPENNGREGLFINLIYLSFSLFGVSIWSFKLVPALAGILTILGVFLFTRELLQTSNFKSQASNRIALFSSFFTATSFWHINFSRIGFRAILVPLVLTFSLYFLIKGFRTKKIWNFVGGGLILGLGLHTYIAFRITGLVAALVLLLLFWIYKKRNQQKEFFCYSTYFIIAALIISAPMLIYFLKNPQHFISRATGVSIFAQSSPIKAFLDSLGKHLVMFNFFGDSNWRHNFAGRPILLWPVGILFLIGLITSIKRGISYIKSKNYSLLITHYSLLTWWFLGILPGVLTYEGIPHALRCIGAIPPTLIFAGLGTELLYHKTKPMSFIKRNLSCFKIIILILLLVLTCFQYSKYFVKWGPSKEVEGAFSKRYVEIGRYLNSLPESTKKYVIINQSGVVVPYPGNRNLPMPGQTVLFIERTKFGEAQSIYLNPNHLEQIKPNRETVIVPLTPNQKLFNKLKEIFPQGTIEKKDQFWVYKIHRIEEF